MIINFKVFKVFLLLNFILLNFKVYSQVNYKEIDSISKQIQYTKNLNRLVLTLTKDLKTDIEKARAIYIWITENIEYDYKSINKNKRNVFKCNGKKCDLKYIKYQNNLINKTLRSKKAVCSGYSYLFKRMCDLANIQCSYVEGYIKNNPSHVGKMGILDHAWNSLKIDNKTYYLDITWASGFCTKDSNGKLKKFIKNRNDFYWFTPEEKFFINHYPKNKNIISGIFKTKEEFKNQPYIENDIISIIDSLLPINGIINTNVGDSITFKFNYSGIINRIQINTNIKKNPKAFRLNKDNFYELIEKNYNLQEFISYSKKKNYYEFKYLIYNDKIRYIEILFDFKTKIKYLVNVNKN